MPEYIQKALEKGFTITHKGTLVTCLIPSAANIPRVRLLFVATEAVLCFAFWAMKRKDIDYGIDICCRWPRALIKYGGLCSHNALLEGVIGNFGLSAEELETIHAQGQARRSAYNSAYYQHMRETDLVGLQARKREQVQRTVWYRQTRRESTRHASGRRPKRRKDIPANYAASNVSVHRN